jgi:hypothetical protein
MQKKETPVMYLCKNMDAVEALISTIHSFPHLFAFMVHFHREKLKGWWILDFQAIHPDTDQPFIGRLVGDFDGLDRSFPCDLLSEDYLEKDVRTEEEPKSMEAFIKVMMTAGMGFGVMRKEGGEEETSPQPLTKNVRFFSKVGENKVEAFLFDDMEKQLKEIYDRKLQKAEEVARLTDPHPMAEKMVRKKTQTYPFTLVNSVISL